MTTKELSDRLCPDVVREVYEEDGLAFVETAFPYPTGDFITLQILDRDGDLLASDDGMVAYWLAVDGVEITETRSSFIKSASLLHDVVFDGETFSRKLSRETLGADLIALCQTIIRVSTLRYDRSSRTAQTLPGDVKAMFDEVVVPQRPYVADWTDLEIDNKSSNHVDYHFNERGDPSNVFVAQSQQRADAVNGIIRFWQFKVPGFKSMCILPEDLKLSQATGNRLRDAADEVVSGLKGNESRIADFALLETGYRRSLFAGAVPSPVR